jgi:hypothetical protein
MLGRGLAGLAFALVIGAAVMAEETRGTITKIADDSITVRTGGFGFGGKGGKAEEKTFKVSKDTKVIRSQGKDKDDVKLTIAELKTAMKVTNVFVTITHDDDNKASEIKTGGGGFGGGKGKGKGKGKKKKDDDE